MQIRALEIQGFRPFDEPQRLDFTKLRPGLYHLTGRNEVEPSLESNGAGKSSLLEAPCWIAYGTTSRKLKAGNVKHWGTKTQCGGILDVKTEHNDVLVLRTWSPNKLEVVLNGEEQTRVVDQRELDALLGVSFEAYLFSMYFAQFTPSFIDLGAAEQMGLFSTILGLDLWEQASDSAGALAKQADLSVQSQIVTISGLEGQYGELEALSFDEPERVWLESMEREERAQQEALEKATTALTAAREESAKAKEGAATFKAKREVVQDWAKKCAVAHAEAERLRRELQALKGKDIKNCPSCGQPVTKKHIKEEIAAKEKAVEEADGKATDLVDEHDKAMKVMVKYRDEEIRYVEAERKVSTALANQRTARNELDRINAAQNPFESKRQEVARRLIELKGRLDEANANLDRLETKKGQADFWARSFKELRLSLIEESLAQLSIEANAALVELGLKDWALRFDVERETKTRGVKRGFTVMVEAPHVGEPVPWEVWSGGEGQRLRVAATLGFAELIASRMGLAPNVEFWDEPSTWLSSSGIYDLLAVLEERARRRGKVILLADHRALDFGGFAGRINVVKTAKGSRVETYNS